MCASPASIISKALLNPFTSITTVRDLFHFEWTKESHQEMRPLAQDVTQLRPPVSYQVRQTCRFTHARFGTTFQLKSWQNASKSHAAATSSTVGKKVFTSRVFQWRSSACWWSVWFVPPPQNQPVSPGLLEWARYSRPAKRSVEKLSA